LEDLAKEDAGTFYGHLAYISAFLYILWTFGIFNDYWVYFIRFGMLSQQKSGNPD
jgi:hypothetical protein